MIRPLLLAIGLVLLGFIVSGQEFDVREFNADPSDLAAIRYPRKSVNDEPCALIKVVTNIQGMQFDSNLGIVDIVHQPDEGYWIYVPPRERRIRLMATGYLPLDLSLPEPAMQNRVYNLVVASRGLAGNIELIPVNFIIDGHPDAILYIGEESFPINQAVQLARGIYDIRIEKPGYRPISTQIEVSETNNLFRYQLEGINEEIVTIRTNPSGADVYLNNVRRQGKTPLQEFLFPGSYDLRITLNEYNDVETRIMVQEGQNNEFTFDLQKFIGTLVLTVDPSDARVTVNQRNYTGQKEIQFAPGTYRILVEKEGYYTQEERFVIQEGQRSEMSFDLIPKTGSLRFVSTNPDANFRLLNTRGETIRQWNGSTLLRDLHIGSYNYTGVLQGYGDLEGSLTIIENQETRVDAVFTDALRQEYLQEQERINAEALKQQNLQKAQEDKVRREAQERENQQNQAQQQKTSNLFKQETYGTINLSYAEVTLPTTNFKQNFESSAGISLGMTGVFKWWAMNLNGTFGTAFLNEMASGVLGTETVETLSYSFTMGPAIRLIGFEFFLVGGWEGSMVSSDVFDEDLLVGDAIVEYGVIFMPRKWSVGLRYAKSTPLGLVPSYPPFSRQEFGIVFKF